jgi:2-iminobutanoate/2-iminopropanoate deaminase
VSRKQASARQGITLAEAASGQPYSDAVWQQDILFLSGRVGLGPDGVIVDRGIAEETRQAIANVAMVLEQAGLTLDNVVRATIYLLTMDDYAAMNQAYVAAFAEPLPARTCVAVAGLPLGARVEIEMVAVRLAA